MSTPDVVTDRLEEQLKWYDKKSAYSKRMFKWLKTATLAISVSIPLNAAFTTRYPAIIGVITGVMGASIALLVGLQQLKSVPSELDYLPLDCRGAEARKVPLLGQGWSLPGG